MSFLDFESSKNKKSFNVNCMFFDESLEKLLGENKEEENDDWNGMAEEKRRKMGALEFLTPDSPVVFSSGPRIGA